MQAKRSFTAVLALMLLVSCGQSPTEADTGETKGSESTTSATAVTTDYLSTISADLGGKPFRIIVNSMADRPNLHEEEHTGEVINDAMVDRDRKIEEKFNTKLEYTAYEARLELSRSVQTSISAGEDICDVIITTPFEGINSFALNGMLSDLSGIAALDLSAEWWSASMNEAMTHKGKTYATAGPMALCYCYSPYAFFVNLNMADDYKLPNVYEMVRDGKWTIDSMTSMMKGISADLDNDGAMGIDDRYGLVTTLEAGKAFYLGCGQRMAVKTDDSAELKMDGKNAIDVLEKLSSIMMTDDTICADGKIAGMGATSDAKIKFFLESRALFTASPLQWGVINFRDMKDDYAILPYPKYDEAQDSYYTHMNSYFPYGIAVPITNSRLDETGAVMEAMAYLSQTTVLPKINEVVLKEKIARDEDSKEMLDILFRNVIIDLNTIFDFGGSAKLLRSFAVGESENFVSSYASLKSVAEADILAMSEAYENID